MTTPSGIPQASFFVATTAEQASLFSSSSSSSAIPERQGSLFSAAERSSLFSIGPSSQPHPQPPPCRCPRHSDAQRVENAKCPPNTSPEQVYFFFEDHTYCCVTKNKWIFLGNKLEAMYFQPVHRWEKHNKVYLKCGRLLEFTWGSRNVVTLGPLQSKMVLHYPFVFCPKCQDPMESRTTSSGYSQRNCCDKCGGAAVYGFYRCHKHDYDICLDCLYSDERW